MTPRHVYVADDAVMEFFTGRNKREREELLKFSGRWLNHRIKRASGVRKQNPAASCRSNALANGWSTSGWTIPCWKCGLWT
jgi:hypothetical protein